MTDRNMAKPMASMATPAQQHGGMPTVPVASTAPSKWGRVADDGTVYVRTAEGERAVGSWQAGEPEAGLAHYARKFDDLRTEAELLAARLASGAGDPKQALTTAQGLRAGLGEAAVVGDLISLDQQLEQLIAAAEKSVASGKAAKEEARTAATARKQALVDEAEELAASATQWKTAGDRLRQMLDQWKTIRGVDRKTDEQLWRRFAKARDTFNRRRGAHFAELDRLRTAAKSRKQELVDEAKKLAESSDWGDTAAKYRELMAEWKSAGRAQRDADDTLWQQFKQAQDSFFARRSAAFAERDAELIENAQLKEKLLVEAESLDPASGIESARAQLYKIQERWDKIGKVPRDRMRELEGRLRAVEEKIRGAADARWRKSDPEAEARVAQFRERVAQFETQAAKAKAAGDERKAQQAQAQAEQWREWLTAAEQSLASR